MAVDYGIHDLRGNRTVVLPGVLDGLSSNFHAQQFGLRAETGYRFDVWSRVGATPYAGLQAQWFHVPGYNEIDASGVPIFALGYASSTVADSRSEFGLRGDYVLGAARDWALALRGRVAWAHDFNGAPSSISRFLALPATSFEVSGAGIARDAALTTAGFEYKLANGFSFLGKFDGTFASTANVYAGSGTLRMNW
jgi:outer membrane autotransporter protein